MEEIIDRITKSLALTDAEEQNSLSIFDENDNKICAIGKLKVTEREAATIRQCLISPWRNSVRIKIGKVSFLCLRVSNILQGHGNLNKPNAHEERNCSTSRIDEKTHVLKRCQTETKEVGKHPDEKVTLSALIVKDFVVILVGRAMAENSLLKATKDVAEILDTSLNAI